MYVYMCMYMCICVCICAYVYVGLWCSGLHQGSNPGRGGEMFIVITTTLYCGTIGKRLKENHISTGTPKPCEGNLELGNCSESHR